MEANNVILAAVKENEEMTGILVDLLSRIAQVKDIYCEFMDKITAKDEKDTSIAECAVMDALEEVEPQLDELAGKFSQGIGLAIQTGLIDVIYSRPNNV